MKLKTNDAAIAMSHLIVAEQNPHTRPNVAVWRGDKRYGGFASYDHIAFWLKHQGLTFADIRIEELPPKSTQ